jgi:hypothetical protein
MKIQEKQSMAFLVYGAMIELMLDMYGNTHLLTYFDHTLLTKHKNLMPSWERESKKIFAYLEKSGNVEVIQQYHNLTRVFEAVIGSTKSMKDLTELMNIIESWEKGELKVVDS